MDIEGHYAYLNRFIRRFQSLAANIYELFGPSAELSSRATASLLASLTLIGLSLSDRKPNSVQVLGFDIQSDHWLYLAIPLALVVVYLATQLVLAWALEARRYRYVIKPKIHGMIALGRDVMQAANQNVDRHLKQAEEMRVVRSALYEWYQEKRGIIFEERMKLLFDSDDDFDVDIDKEKARLEESTRQLEIDYARKKTEAGVEQFDQENDRLVRSMIKREPSPLERLAKELTENLEKSDRIKRWQIRLGLHIPSYVALASLVIFAISISDLLASGR